MAKMKVNGTEAWRDAIQKIGELPVHPIIKRQERMRDGITTLISDLREESDLCRNVTAYGSAELIDRAIEALTHLSGGDRLTPTEESRYEALEKEHLGDPNKGTGIYAQALAARRWNALIGCARIRALGSAGLSDENNPYGEPWGNFAHVGVELWTKHTPEIHSDLGIKWLTEFADKAILANAERDKNQCPA